MTGDDDQLFDRVILELGEAWVHRTGTWIHGNGRKPGAGWVRRTVFVFADPIGDAELVRRMEP